jgi:putative ABC transport system substrate-binding protein
MKSSVRRNRRAFLLVACASLWSPPPRAQRALHTRLVGVLSGNPYDSIGQASLSAFRHGLERAGWKEGRNIEIDHRWGEGDPGRIRAQADELVKRSPDVIAVHTATALREVRRATAAIPIVFWAVSDPLGNKFVSNLSRPGGNVTGFSLFEYDMGPKWLQLLKEAAPRVARVLVLMHSNNPNLPGWLRTLEPSAPLLGIRIAAPKINDGKEIEAMISAFAREPNGGLLVLPDPQLLPYRDVIIKVAATHKLPAIYGVTRFSEHGGLMAYAAEQGDLANRAAMYVARILNGERPGDLPIQQPTKFELAINNRTARALGLKLPRTLLMRADLVIE